MNEYLKNPIWKPGDYTNLILETTKLEGEKLIFLRQEFQKKMVGKKISEHGIAFDLHNLYKKVPGKSKSEALK